jgi:hypothetical protein
MAFDHDPTPAARQTCAGSPQRFNRNADPCLVQVPEKHTIVEQKSVRPAAYHSLVSPMRDNKMSKTNHTDRKPWSEIVIEFLSVSVFSVVVGVGVGTVQRCVAFFLTEDLPEVLWQTAAIVLVGGGSWTWNSLCGSETRDYIRRGSPNRGGYGNRRTFGCTIVAQMLPNRVVCTEVGHSIRT